MTAKGADASAAYGNPLIPNARLRQIYLAMVQARMLEKALPASRRARTLPSTGKAYAVGAAGLEACIASTSVDLGPDDLVSDALTGGMVEFLRGAGLRKVFNPASKDRPRGSGGGYADCGSAAQILAAPGPAERLWMAMGAAAALKARTAQAKLEAKASAKAQEESENAKQASQPAVVMAYVRPGEVATALWRKALGHAAEKELPVLFVVMPAARTDKGSAKVGVISALALTCGVPGIAVDGDDAVAIYRVAQESIGRARAGGGTALIECVPFVLPARTGKVNAAEDAIAGMQRYMLQRGVVTGAWIEREARAFARRLAKR